MEPSVASLLIQTFHPIASDCPSEPELQHAEWDLAVTSSKCFKVLILKATAMEICPLSLDLSVGQLLPRSFDSDIPFDCIAIGGGRDMAIMSQSFTVLSFSKQPSWGCRCRLCYGQLLTTNSSNQDRSSYIVQVATWREIWWFLMKLCRTRWSPHSQRTNQSLVCKRGQVAGCEAILQ
jgi:hypothetical protein